MFFQSKTTTNPTKYVPNNRKPGPKPSKAPTEKTSSPSNELKSNASTKAPTVQPDVSRVPINFSNNKTNLPSVDSASSSQTPTAMERSVNYTRKPLTSSSAPTPTILLEDVPSEAPSQSAEPTCFLSECACETEAPTVSVIDETRIPTSPLNHSNHNTLTPSNEEPSQLPSKAELSQSPSNSAEGGPLMPSLAPFVQSFAPATNTDSGYIPSSYPTKTPFRQLNLTHCFVPQIAWIGDGWCDSQDGLGNNLGYNSPECLYDGGDCCESTCVSSALHVCGVVKYACKDPNAT